MKYEAKSFILYSECVKKQFHHAFRVSFRVSEIAEHNETNRTFSKIVYTFIDINEIDNRFIKSICERLLQSQQPCNIFK